MRLSGRKPSSFTRSWSQRQRIVVVALLGLNVAGFVAQLFLEQSSPGVIEEYLGLSWIGVQNAYAWQFFTSAFLQGSAWHLAANVAALYLLGRDVESVVGQRHFLFLYLAGSFAGELGHLFLMPQTSVLLAGFGGVAAVLMAYATILPELELTSAFFIFPLRIKAKYLAYAAVASGLLLLAVSRSGMVTHSATLGGCAAGWLYAHLLGFGRPSVVQRALHQRKLAAERYRLMDADQFISEEVDPLLEKISRSGIQSLSRRERRTLTQAREKLARQA